MTDSDAILKAIQAEMRAAQDEARRELNRQLFASVGNVAVDVARDDAVRRWARAVRFYILNWRDALKACARAAIGRDAIPECDHEDYY